VVLAVPHCNKNGNSEKKCAFCLPSLIAPKFFLIKLVIKNKDNLFFFVDNQQGNFKAPNFLTIFET